MQNSNRPLPPLNALKAFEAAGRHLNFRVASEELHVTQGAVAQQIKNLEHYMGFALFDRQNKGVTLTEKGSLYFLAVTKAFEALKEATAHALKQPNMVTISVTPSFATKILLPHLPLLTEAVPDVDIRIVATESIADFKRDNVDIAVRLAKPPFAKHLTTKLLFKQDLVAVASPHLIDINNLPIPPAQLKNMPLLHDSHHHWYTVFNTTGKLPGAVFNQSALAIDAALAGQGIAIACRAFVQSHIDNGSLVVVSHLDIEVESDYYLVCSLDALENTSVDAVWQWCTKNL